jgi:hypothetical protein
VAWDAELKRANALADAEGPNNPFGIQPQDWRACQDIWPGGFCRQAIALWRQGRSNRAGTLFPAPKSWEAGVAACPCWTDLQLEFAVLRAVRARPLAWLQPLEGDYADYTPYSAAARAVVYDRYLATARAAGVPATAWVAFDTDPHFENSFGHFTPRGWLLADRLLNVFWHGGLGSLGPGLPTGSAVAALFPHNLACPEPLSCAGLRPLPPAAVPRPPAGPAPAVRPVPATAA